MFLRQTRTQFPNMMRSGLDLAGFTPLLESRLEYAQRQRQAQRELVQRYRRYEAGTQTARLNADQLALFPDGKDPEHAVNVCPIICSTISDRVQLQSVSILEDDLLTEVIQSWWQMSLMDSIVTNLHYVASRDGDVYLQVWFDPDDNAPRFSIQYQDDGYDGTDIIYDEGTNEPLYATRRWTITNPDDNAEEWARLNVYYDNRVEKYISKGMSSGYVDAGWMPFTDEAEDNPAADRDQPHIEWWTSDGTPTGEPLGLSIIHFPANAVDNYGRSDLADVVPALQDQLNDASVDLRIATKFAGSKLRYLFGVQADASAIVTHPGGLMVSSDKDVTAGEFTESNLVQLIDAKDSIYRDISTVTGIPLANINPTAQVAAEGTLQQQEAPLIAKVQKRTRHWANAYEQVIRLALKLDATYGNTTLPLDAIDELSISVQFAPAQVRNEFQDAQRAQLFQQLGVPMPIILREVLGMDADVIAEVEDMLEQERGNRLEEVALTTRQSIAQTMRERGAQIRAQQTGNATDEQQPEPEPATPRAAIDGTGTDEPDGN